MQFYSAVFPLTHQTAWLRCITGFRKSIFHGRRFLPCNSVTTPIAPTYSNRPRPLLFLITILPAPTSPCAYEACEPRRACFPCFGVAPVQGGCSRRERVYTGGRMWAFLARTGRSACIGRVKGVSARVLRPTGENTKTTAGVPGSLE